MQELYEYLAGIVMSLFFAYFPKVKDWFLALSGNQRRFVLFGFTVLVAGGYFGLSCTNLAGQLGILTPCTKDAATQAVILLVKMFVGSQAAYTFLPDSVKSQ